MSTSLRADYTRRNAGRTPIIADSDWSPLQWSGLLAFLRADVVTVTDPGLKLVSWPDQSGQGADFVQAVDADRLQWTASDADFKGQPSLSGTAIAAGLTRTGFAQGEGIVTLGGTMRFNANTVVCIVFGDNAQAASMVNNATGLFDVNRNVGGVNQRRLSGAQLNRNYTRVAVIPCATAAADDPILYTDGVAGGTVTSSTATNGVLPAGMLWRAGFHMEGKFTELFAMSRQITVPEVAQYHSYANARYG